MSTHNSKSQSFDVAVIGAGVIGLAAGWRAAQRGLHTLVVDAAHPAHGATRAAAGMLAPVSEATFGEEHVLPLTLEAARGYPAFVEELGHASGVSIAYRQCGSLTVALNRDDAELLHRLHDFQRSLDLEAEWLSRRECREIEPGLSPSVVGGVRSSGDHQVSPRSLADALRVALERAGGELRAQAPVESVIASADRVTGVVLSSGSVVEAGQVVIAAGWQSSRIEGLPAGARPPVRPVKGQVLRLRGDPAAPVAGRTIGTPEVYVVPRGDGRVVVGATVEDRGPDTTVTAGGVFELLRAAYEVLPGVSELELLETTAGLRPAAPDNAPIVGAGALEGLVWATGHWRNGILLAPITADAVAAVLTGEPLPEVFRPFTPDRFARDASAVEVAAR